MLAGPTGAGKTDLIAALDSDRFEIVSLDSRQVYRYLSIGTAAPEPALLRRMPHHLVGFLDPDQTITAKQYCEKAELAIRQIIARGKIPLLVGGAGFYLEMLSSGAFEVPESPEVIQQVKSMEHAQRLEMLKKEDPSCLVQPGQQPSRGRIHPNDAYRVERFLVMVLSSGKTIEELWMQKDSSQDGEFNYSGWFLFPGEEALWQRLRIRAAFMIDQGLLEEARYCRLHFGLCAGLRILGYPEALACLDGDMEREELAERLWIVHRQYARRQRIWFQKRSYVQFVESATAAEFAGFAVNLFDGSGINH
ncbi:MAG: tRNA (adenosine(37)-N6)-dimethylallyltransferase MiaA [Leptospiraceae bacterium]|nr:tRNA (adenosine(37)-N6)-dimethylallyltransferase MiaA [Leptospiraceae bacterium]